MCPQAVSPLLYKAPAAPPSDPTASVTSGMDWSSHVKLYTRRPITVHPHAEKREMRRRYELQYLTYARVEERIAYDGLKQLKGDYMLLSNCMASCASGKGYDYIAQQAWPRYGRFIACHSTRCL